MFNKVLIEIDSKLCEADVRDITLIRDRLDKINHNYFYDLILSKHIVETNGHKSVLRKELRRHDKN